ncbi:MAG TPA: YafY family protein [Ktedonobacterales bacterium]|nr:YafY family protein [Ktedonobacterales bacterium]
MAHSAYSPAARLLMLLDLLQSRPHLSSERLAEALDVDPRSARRYIVMLQDMGIPIEARRGRYGGYALRPGYKLPPLMLTDDEALAITLGLLAAPRLGLTEMQHAITGALAKLERVLPIQTRERVQAIREAVALDAPATDTEQPPTRLDHIARCSAAARGRVRLRMVYQRDDSPPTERMFDCYGVVHHAARWYAIGYCHLRQDTRVFRLDRVRMLEPCDERFTRPKDFDCLAYAIDAFAAIPDRWLAQALLDMPFAEACRQIPPDFATLEETSDGVLWRAYDKSLEHAARFLIGLGRPFQVIGPPEILDALSDLARDITATVSRGLLPAT